MRSSATDYVPFSNQISEEARKRLRVQRLHQSKKEDYQSKVDDLEKSEWAKTQSLK